MKKDFHFYFKLFWATFSLSAFTFGGGYIIVPLMRKKFVEEYGWIEENEILDLTAIAQSSPGAIAVNASIIIGYRLAGIAGAFVSMMGTILPPFLILSVISLFYQAFRDSSIVSALMKGMQAGVAAVICDAVISMGADVLKKKSVLSVILMIAVFVASFLFNVNVVLIILLCAAVGFVSTLYREKHNDGGDKK